MGSRTRTAGFTLIEMMVALFVAMIIFTVGFMTISGAITARREAEARIHAAENARLFFQMLEKDLNGAYPFPGVSDITTLIPKPASGVSMSVNGKNVAVASSDRIELLTHLDHRNVTVEYVFVRYFVNSLGHLCRQISTADTAAAAVSNAPFNVNDDTYALFDQTYALLVSPAQWVPSSKSLTVTPGAACTVSTTNIQPVIYMFGYNGSLLAIDNSGATKRVFQKTLAVPVAFGGQP